MRNDVVGVQAGVLLADHAAGFDCTSNPADGVGSGRLPFDRLVTPALIAGGAGEVLAWGSTRILDADLSPLLSLPRLTELRMKSRREYKPSVKEVQSELVPPVA